MRSFACFTATLLAVASLAAAAPASAASVMAPAHKAVVQPPAAGASCMDNSRYVSHVAYVPSQREQTMRCGHLLSTDTLLTVHHWDKT